ncbi:TetR/AcrR family transcriptional regulator [Bordetella sp. 2513F-2]
MNSARLRNSRQPASRQRRADGNSTRAGIVEAAGRLYAERGYAGTTSKAICERAGVNLAAINYHFGSRDGMYLAVLQAVHERILSLDFVRGLAGDAREPAEKLRAFLHALVVNILDGGNWAIRVWAREVLAPSPLLPRVMRENTQPKFDVLSGILADITGVPPHDARMTQLVLSVLSPCLVLLLAGRDQDTPIQALYAADPARLADALWAFAMAGLRDAASA